MEFSQQQMERMIRENGDASLGGPVHEAARRPKRTRVQLGARAAMETVDVSDALSDEESEDKV